MKKSSGKSQPPRKRNLSWHQKGLRRTAIVLATICLVIFACLFYWINHRLLLSPN